LESISTLNFRNSSKECGAIVHKGKSNLPRRYLLEDGEKRNLRDAFRKFEEASESSHKDATRELEDYYLWERMLKRSHKIAELGNLQATLTLKMKME